MKKTVLAVNILISGLMLVGCQQSNVNDNQSSKKATVEDMIKIVEQVSLDNAIQEKLKEDVNRKQETTKIDDTTKTSNEEKEVSMNSHIEISESTVNQDTSSTVQSSSNNSSSDYVTSKPEPVVEEQKTETPKKEETVITPLKEEPKNYQVGNSGMLFDSEEQADMEAVRMFNDYSDSEKYISRYWIWSTYDKWTIEYEYSYWE